MVCNLNMTNLRQIDGGHLIMQGDLASTFGFALLDEDYQVISSLGGEGGTDQSDQGGLPVEGSR